MDPKGVIGPAVMECGRYIQNFIEDEPGVGPVDRGSEASVRQVLSSRVARFASYMDVPAADVAVAGYVDLVVSTCWSRIDGQAVEDRMKLIGIMQQML